jgi:hypothetical protein
METIARERKRGGNLSIVFFVFTSKCYDQLMSAMECDAQCRMIVFRRGAQQQKSSVVGKLSTLVSKVRK